MYQLIFRNWKFALLWVVGISISVASFLEKGGGKDRMEASAQQIREHRQGIAAEPAPIAPQGMDDQDDPDSIETEAPLTAEAEGTDAAAADQDQQG